MVTTLRQESTSGVPVLAYNTNLKKLEVETFELTNKFIADYQFNYLEDKYNASLAYPGDDTKNQSYLKHGFLKQADTIKLPGFLTSDLVTANLEQKYSFYQKFQSYNSPIKSIKSCIAQLLNSVVSILQ
ncbi:MAG: hypothetical protein ONB27_12485 [candidate division KSB1 bacterium]|nr:hypothetical protein [candidate division KSB1 bacterium]